MSSVLISLRDLPCFAPTASYKPKSRVLVRCLGGGESGSGYGVASVGRKDVESLNDVGNGHLSYGVGEKKRTEGVLEKLEPLWDDGYGTQSMEDYFKLAKTIIKPDGGPPRWFCPVSCGKPLNNSPILLYLPGLGGSGVGLIMHEKALGKVFEVRCLHVPVRDRTPFQDLVKFVEETVRLEQASCPKKPIYLLGESFGGCLALAVAARNPTVDLVLILANPATSFRSSQLKPLTNLLEALPDELYGAFFNTISGITGNQMKMEASDIEGTHPLPVLGKLSGNLTAMLLYLSGLVDASSKDALIWKLKLLGSAAAYVESRLHAVRAEVLLLVSGKDNVLPSKDEAQRLSSSLKDCRICFFPDKGHTILLESDVNLMLTIRRTLKYRLSPKKDFISDFFPLSISEYRTTYEGTGWYRLAINPVMFSTLKDGKIVRGLGGVPSEGPVLLVGYHALMGFELLPLVLEFLKEKNIMIRGLAHPEIFKFDHQYPVVSDPLDQLRILGALPVTASNLFKLLSTKSHILLYPGGAREAFHRKGEAYKLFWPEEQEFARMAARFGATIVPFGVVGEDDISELILDYNEMMRIPVLNDYLREFNKERTVLRQDLDGEIANQLVLPPLVLPKMPGRLYYLFGKPIETKGMENVLKDREAAQALYLQIKGEVEKSLAYLIKKREEDPYRGFVQRAVYQATTLSPLDQIPTFRPSKIG